MKSRLLGAVFGCLFFTATDAALVSRLDGQAVYDTDLDITWLANANLVATNTFNVSGINPVDGRMNWITANTWINAMNSNNYLNFNGWRLPTTLFPDATCDGSTDPGSPGLNCAGSELGHLFYVEFVAIGGTSVIDTGNPVELSKFSNLQTDLVNGMSYWSGTEFAIAPNLAWSFHMHNGLQNANDKTNGYHAWAVLDGDIITIDIKPSKKPGDVINLKKDKNIKVAIVGDATFDALQVDPATVKFGPTGSSGVSPVRFKGQDNNRDGVSDLVLTFKLSDTGISCGVTEATLTGETVPEPIIYITGSDSFTVVEPC